MNSSERRRQAKANLKKSESVALAKMEDQLPDGATWVFSSRDYKEPEQAPKEPEMPGVNCRPIDAEFEEKCSRNSWHDREELPEFVNTILDLSEENKYEEDGNTLKPGRTDWSWARNWNCKYIDIRIDMRDGGFVLTDGEGKRINLTHLKWQYKSLKEKEEEDVKI